MKEYGDKLKTLNQTNDKEEINDIKEKYQISKSKSKKKLRIE